MIETSPLVNPKESPVNSIHEGEEHKQKTLGTGVDFGSITKEEAVEISPEDVKPDDCAICFEVFEIENGEVYTVANCNHKFHEACIKKWKERNTTCPFCRGKLPEELGETLTIESSDSTLSMGTMDSFEDFQPLPPLVPLQVSKLSNLCYSPLGVIWPVLVLTYVIIIEMIVFFVYLSIFLPYRLYMRWRSRRNQGRGTGPACMIVFCCFLYPFLVLLRVWLFLFRMSLCLFFTVRFYLYVLLCRCKWSDAGMCIIDHTDRQARLLLFSTPIPTLLFH